MNNDRFESLMNEAAVRRLTKKEIAELRTERAAGVAAIAANKKAAAATKPADATAK